MDGIRNRKFARTHFGFIDTAKPCRRDECKAQHKHKLKMKFINFTQHLLSKEQIDAARLMGADEIINVSNPSRFNDNGITSPSEIVNEIAQEIARLVNSDECAIVHFPISSPRVMAAFWKKLGRLYAWDNDFGRYEYSPVWNIIILHCKFVFSHTDRELVEEHQSDGSVIKKTVFCFKGFVK